MWGYIVILIGIVFFLIDAYLVYVSLGFRKSTCKTCKGYLDNVTRHKDHYAGGKAGRFYKSYLDYVYVYRVNGQEYRISGGVPGAKENLPSSVDIVYQQKNPKLAYIKKLTFPIQPIVALLLLPLWILLVILGIVLL